MTIASKVNAAASNTLTQLNPLPRPAAPVISDRQIIADSGKVAPSALTYEQLVDVRKKELNNAVRTVSGYVQNITRELNFSIDEKLGKTVVTVVDQSTGDVIRQIPSEDMLELSRNLTEIRERSAKGLLFKGDA
jgi:flagellar protein FlaG